MYTYYHIWVHISTVISSKHGVIFLCNLYAPIQFKFWYNSQKEVYFVPVSDAQRRAIAKHVEKLDDIKIRVPAGDRQKYKGFAAENGYSLNALVVGLLDEAMAGKIPLPPRR